MIYLYLQATQASTEGLTQLSSIYSQAATTFLFLFLTAIAMIIAEKVGLLGERDEEYPEFLSHGNSIQLGAGLAITFTLYFIFLFLTKGTTGTQSIFQLPNQNVFAQAGSSLGSKFWVIEIIGVTAPLAEELFFAFVIATLVFKLFHYITTEQLDLPFPTLLTIGITIAITSIAFAQFHISQQINLYFILIAILFRSLILATMFIEELTPWIPWINAGVGTGFGLHLANNLSCLQFAGSTCVYGLSVNPLQVLMDFFATDGTIFGGILMVIVLVFFASSFYSAYQLVWLGEGVEDDD